MPYCGTPLTTAGTVGLYRSRSIRDGARTERDSELHTSVAGCGFHARRSVGSTSTPV
jgi:hypothetical protein